MTAWIIVKIAVVPPIPKARVSVAAAVNTGDIRNCLKVYRTVLRKSALLQSVSTIEVLLPSKKVTKIQPLVFQK